MIAERRGGRTDRVGGGERQIADRVIARVDHDLIGKQRRTGGVGRRQDALRRQQGYIAAGVDLTDRQCRNRLPGGCGSLDIHRCSGRRIERAAGVDIDRRGLRQFDIGQIVDRDAVRQVGKRKTAKGIAVEGNAGPEMGDVEVGQGLRADRRAECDRTRRGRDRQRRLLRRGDRAVLQVGQADQDARRCGADAVGGVQGDVAADNAGHGIGADRTCRRQQRRVTQRGDDLPRRIDGVGH